MLSLNEKLSEVQILHFTLTSDLSCIASILFANVTFTHLQGWRMVKSETRRDAEILVRNPSPRHFGKKFRDSKKVKTNHAKTRLRDLSKTLPRFRDPAKIFRDPCFSRHHSPPLLTHVQITRHWKSTLIKKFNLRA